MKLCLVSGMLFAGVIAVVAQGGTPRTVWDGVYTELQAVRGEKVSAAQCARCHGQTLTGAEAAPPLTGALFNANWEGVPLGELFERIRVSMPLDAAGTMSRQQTVDVIAYMLKVGKFPVGDAELPTEAAALMQVTFVSNRP
jgi:quinoprotein glucose dehydrogenase